MRARWPRVLAVCAAPLVVAGTLSAAAVGRTGAAEHGTVAARAASPAGTAAAGHTAAAGPFATLLFSRTEMTAADNCVPDNTGIATLDKVAPFLHSLGMAGTGTLITGKTGQTTRHCSHRNESLNASWADATHLADTFGWSFVSHTATYPKTGAGSRRLSCGPKRAARPIPSPATDCPARTG